MKTFRALTVPVPTPTPKDRAGEGAFPLDRLGTDIDVLVSEYSGAAGETELPLLTWQRSAFRYAPKSQLSHSVDLHGTLENYIAALPRKACHELMRKLRHFPGHADGGECGVREYRSPDVLDEFLDAAHSISRNTYQFRFLRLGVPKTAAFRAEMRALAAEGRFRGYLLNCAGKPVAFGICRVNGQTLEYLQTGYEPSMGHTSPGIVLLYGLLAHAFREGCCAVLDFGIGDAPWKRMYATRSLRHADVYYFDKTVSNVFWVLAHLCITGVSDFFGCMLSNLGVKVRVRHFTHRAIAPLMQAPRAQPAGNRERGQI